MSQISCTILVIWAAINCVHDSLLHLGCSSSISKYHVSEQVSGEDNLHNSPGIRA